MFIKPKEGLIVRDPETMQPLPPEGKEVTGMISHWMRRIQDGSVEEVKQPKAVEKPAQKAAAPAEQKVLSTAPSSQNTKQGDKT